jgi:DNA-binding Lrp family transcriptional regulator
MIYALLGINMHDMIELDRMDRKLLAALQRDARLTNQELAERIGLSASQCSRRRSALEASGIITGYHAHLDKEKSGFGLTSIISVTLATHNPDNANRLAELFRSLENVQEAYSLTGEMDYFIKVVTPDLRALSEFINTKLLPHDAVLNVKTAVVLDNLKESSDVPIST